MRKDYEVLLSRQAIAILKQAHAISGNRRYIFTIRKLISDNTLNKALRTMGYNTLNEHCSRLPHNRFNAPEQRTAVRR